MSSVDGARLDNGVDFCGFDNTQNAELASSRWHVTETGDQIHSDSGV
jgi:hypothetical protein